MVTGVGCGPQECWDGYICSLRATRAEMISIGEPPICSDGFRCRLRGHKGDYGSYKGRPRFIRLALTVLHISCLFVYHSYIIILLT